MSWHEVPFFYLFNQQSTIDNHQSSSIKYQVSSIKYQVSSIEYQSHCLSVSSKACPREGGEVSSIEHQVTINVSQSKTCPPSLPAVSVAGLWRVCGGLDPFIVLRKSGKYWVSLCLENGLVGQGVTKETAVDKLKEAIDSFEAIRKNESDIYSEPLSIKDLHEFLTVEGPEPILEPMEMRALYA